MTQADVVFTFAYEMLDDAINREYCRITDQTLLALARDERVDTLLAADPWRSYMLSAARRRKVRLFEPTTVAGREVVRVRPHRLRRDDASELVAVERSYLRYGTLLGRALGRARGELAPRATSASLVTYHPFVAAFCDAPWIRKVVYVGRDDWATDTRLAQWADLYREAYKRIDDRGATIFGVSDELAGRVSPRASVVPNGVIADVWRPRYPAPSRIAALPGPRAIYTGSIVDRFDTRLIESTASNVGSLILIGYLIDDRTVRWLRSFGNVHVFGPVGQRELAATVQACDVGILPHRDDEFIRAMSPLKVYEYLAAGLPVVATDLPAVHGIDDERVRFCGREDWANGLAAAIEAGPTSEDCRQRFIDEVSWGRRLRVVVDAAVS